MRPAQEDAGAYPIVPLVREELPVDTVELARFMIGKCLVHDTGQGRVSGRIVETEAYPIGDSTGYAYPGLRAHNAPLFSAPGHAYVRLVYGVSYTLNMSAEAEGEGAAVLLRAVEPLDGVPLMQSRRPGAKHADLARGPGRLCAAFAIGPEQDGADLCGGSLWIGRLNGLNGLNAADAPSGARVAATKRIGLSREMHALLRFYEPGSAFVSGPKRLLEPIGR
jgi:DNA-3-methyladenine glycosylase